MTGPNSLRILDNKKVGAAAWCTACFPGPELVTTKASITCSVMAGFIPANIMLHIAGMLISRYVVHVPRIPPVIMCTVIVGLSVIGPYAIDEGMVPVTEPITRVRVCNTNTNAVLSRRQSHA